jgi:prepilin-type N-terminal cleavage/methylation domain-containing protein
LRAERPTDRGLSPGGTGRGQAGTTLPELLVTLVVFSIIMLVVIALWQQSQQAYFRGATAAELQQNARVALEQMGREVRQAGYDPCRYKTTGCSGATSAFDPVAAGVFPVQTFTATSLWVRADRNGNGNVTPGGGNPDENVCFRLSGTLILRKTSGVDCTSGGEELARNINGLTFTYLKANGTAATVTSDIRIVRISISAQEMFMGAPVNVTLRSDIRLRDQ